MRRNVLLISLGLSIAGCTRAEPQRTAPEPPATPATTQVTPAATTVAPPAKPAAGGDNAPLVLASGIRFVKAGAGDDVPKLIRDERTRAASDGRELIVYVGATWCEPCQRFHEAAKRGDLDAEFPALTIMEFDVDEDRERLVMANYTSKLIPLFVAPDSDGRGSERRFEGGIKGEQAVASITPRLKNLLKKP
jgi:hypothetical protein